jgi:hypothetical protein
VRWRRRRRARPPKQRDRRGFFEFIGDLVGDAVEGLIKMFD